MCMNKQSKGFAALPCMIGTRECTQLEPYYLSKEIKQHTKMTLFPCACHASASSALNTICPTVAPGEAGKPVAITLSLYADGSSN